MFKCDLCDTDIEVTPKHVEVRPSGNWGELTVVINLCCECYRNVREAAIAAVISVLARTGKERVIADRYSKSHASKRLVPSR